MEQLLEAVDFDFEQLLEAVNYEFEPRSYENVDRVRTRAVNDVKDAEG